MIQHNIADVMPYTVFLICKHEIEDLFHSKWNIKTLHNAFVFSLYKNLFHKNIEAEMLPKTKTH